MKNQIKIKFFQPQKWMMTASLKLKISWSTKKSGVAIGKHHGMMHTLQEMPNMVQNGIDSDGTEENFKLEGMKEK